MSVLGISGNSVAKLVGLSSAEMSMRLNGTKPLVGDLAKTLLKLTDALVDLQRTAKLPINWQQDLEQVRAALKLREEAREFHQHLLEEIVEA
jgi:hypothetical protein